MENNEYCRHFTKFGVWECTACTLPIRHFTSALHVKLSINTGTHLEEKTRKDGKQGILQTFYQIA